MLQAREAEERKAEDASNPLKSAIETYALTPADIQAFISYFGAMDVERKGADCFTVHLTITGTENGSGILATSQGIFCPAPSAFHLPKPVLWRWAQEKTLHASPRDLA